MFGRSISFHPTDLETPSQITLDIGYIDLLRLHRKRERTTRFSIDGGYD
jgi:hypothetical protein